MNVCQCTPHLLERRELRTMRESSMREMHSEVSSPFSSSSPLVLNWLKARFLVLQSAMTCFSLVSMSLSLTALMQMSYTNQARFINRAVSGWIQHVLCLNTSRRVA